MRTFEQLEAGWQSGGAQPTLRGPVRLIVARLGQGRHRVLERGELSVEGGLLGDRWSEGSRPKVDRQLTLMNVRAAELVADGQPLHLPGDNVLVELDLGVAAAPAGTRMRLGTALVEVTDEPHTGCAKFRTRFGADALRWVNHEAHAHRRLRGIHCRVVESGTVSTGDLVIVQDVAS